MIYDTGKCTFRGVITQFRLFMAPQTCLLAQALLTYSFCSLFFAHETCPLAGIPFPTKLLFPRNCSQKTLFAKISALRQPHVRF